MDGVNLSLGHIIVVIYELYIYSNLYIIMFARLDSCSILGMEVIRVEVEVNTSGNLPGIYMVGLPDAAVRKLPRMAARGGMEREVMACSPGWTVAPSWGWR